jgi:hypothetical protein
MQERRELHALAARELRQSVADDQRLERVRLLVRCKSGIIGEQLIEEEDAVVRRGPVRPEQERTRLGLASAMQRRISATASLWPSFASQVAASATRPAAGAALFVSSIMLVFSAMGFRSSFRQAKGLPL